MDRNERVLVACLAVFGVIMGVLFLVGILHWIIIAAVILGICYVAFKVADSGKKSLGSEHRSLAKQLKQLEKRSRSTRL